MTSIRPAASAVGLPVLLAALLVLSGCGNSAVPKEAATASEDSSSSAAATSYPTQKKSACDLLTQKVAKSLLGSVAEEAAPARDTGSADVRISSCVRASSVAGLDKARSVSLVMRAAKSGNGAQINEAAFAAESMPKGAEVVSGYGEKAFWNPALGQLNVLDAGNWYVLASGPIDPRKHTLEDTEKLAEAIIDQP